MTSSARFPRDGGDGGGGGGGGGGGSVAAAVVVVRGGGGGDGGGGGGGGYTTKGCSGEAYAPPDACERCYTWCGCSWLGRLRVSGQWRWIARAQTCTAPKAREKKRALWEG